MDFVACLASGLLAQRLKPNSITLSGWKLVRSRFEAGRRQVRTCSKLVADRFEAKFDYAIWFEAGSKLFADRFEAGRGPVADLLTRASSLLAS